MVGVCRKGVDTWRSILQGCWILYTPLPSDGDHGKLSHQRATPTSPNTSPFLRAGKPIRRMGFSLSRRPEVPRDPIYYHQDLLPSTHGGRDGPCCRQRHADAPRRTLRVAPPGAASLAAPSSCLIWPRIAPLGVMRRTSWGGRSPTCGRDSGGAICRERAQQSPNEDETL